MTDYRAAWEELHGHLSWVQGHPALNRYLGQNFAAVANALIDRAYPGLRDRTFTSLQPFMALFVEAESYRQMRDTAVNDLGYPSILEALEELPVMQARIFALTAEVASLATRLVAMRQALAPYAQFADEWDRWQSKGSTSLPGMLAFSYGKARAGLEQHLAARAALSPEKPGEAGREADDLDSPAARLDMVRVALTAIVAGEGSPVALAKAGLDFCNLTAAERAKARGEGA